MFEDIDKVALVGSLYDTRLFVILTILLFSTFGTTTVVCSKLTDRAPFLFGSP